MSPRAVRSDRAPAPVGPYSQAIVHGNLVYAAGQVALDPESGTLVGDDAAAQAERAIENLRAILEAAGSSLEKVLRTTVYLSDLRDYGRVNEVYGRHFAVEPRPARTAIQAARLPAGALVEIDAIAAID